ncbi:protein kinase, partial [Escherichia coli]|nr:protein kinase [Escherichia coli]
GPYRIVREIGRGGMGTVFLAERTDGEFNQRVALKIIRQSVTDKIAVERFRRERELLAGLSHPNIARLLDGGVSESGEPYFAMEFVDGKP